MKRKQIIPITLAVTALQLVNAQQKPNIIVIVADDMGWGDAGSYGGTLIPTPNIDRLALEGVRCTNGYVTAAISGPSRYGILTGAYQQRFGIHDNTDAYAEIPGIKERIPVSQKQLHETLKLNGYKTAIFGKYNMPGYPQTTFDESYSLMHSGGDYFPDKKGRYKGVDEPKAISASKRIFWGPEHPEDEYLTDRLGRQSVEFISKNQSSPFFMYIAFNAPHSPLQAKTEDKKLVKHIEHEAVRFYAAMLHSMDENIGKILNELDTRQLAENTIIIFLSDNGPTYGYTVDWPEEWPKVLLGSAGNLSGHKSKLLEGGIRTPYIIRWPKNLKGGTVYHHPVSALDIYPTVCAASKTKIAHSTKIDGVNLIPYLQGKNKKAPHDKLFWLVNQDGAVRSGKWKLNINKNKVTLHDLEADEAEKIDLSTTEVKIKNNLLNSWEKFCSQMPEPVNQAQRKKKLITSKETTNFLSEEHINTVNKERRIFVQWDVGNDIQRKGGFGSDMDKVMEYSFHFTDMPLSQIDAICIDVSNEGVAHYKSKILRPIQHPGLMKWHEEGLDYFNELIKHARNRNKEIWWGLRMNEVERGDLVSYEALGGTPMYSEDARNPMKVAHPEWLISRIWWWQGLWNYAVKEVRDYRLSIIREVAEQYEFDGVHLDFLRHTPHLPPGKQWENRDHLTSFIRDVRATLQDCAVKRGRPFLFAVRIPDSVMGCHTDGIDIETWAKSGLVDIFIIGTRTMNVDINSFQRQLNGANIKLIPSFDVYHGTDGYHGDLSIDLLCGVFGNYLHQGADGVGVFNIPAGTVEHAKKIGINGVPNFNPEILKTIGSITTITGKPRFYAIERRGGYAHGVGHGSSNKEAPLPKYLNYDLTPTSLSIPIYEKVNTEMKATLRLILFQHVITDKISIELNGIKLNMDTIDTDWKDKRIFSPGLQPETVTPGAFVKNLENQKLTRIDYAVPIEIIEKGLNSINLTLDRQGPFPASKAVKLEKVELHLIPQ